jgi:hypothetical protein
MQTGPTSEFRAITDATAAMSMAYEQDEAQLIAALVDALKGRPDSPIAAAVGNAIERVMRSYDMAPYRRI